MTIAIVSLSECIARDPNTLLVRRVAEIYFQEWGWHFADEWDLHTVDAIEADLREQYLDETFVMIHDDSFIGTVALLPSDLRAFDDNDMRLLNEQSGPWVTCLYVAPEYRGKGYGSRLLNFMVDYANADQQMGCYLWCYTEKERDWYTRHGFRHFQTIPYHEKTAFVMNRYFLV
jgi:GNAT superfamily N-acetyltransferase